MRMRVVAGVLAGGLLLGGCGSDVSLSGVVPEISIPTEFDPAAVMFAQMMIPHHEQAVEMSELALANSTNPEVLAIAKQIKAAQSPEVAQMQQWLELAGVGMDMGHSMHMSGMLSDEQMAELRGASGAEFDRLFLSGMIEHHRGALEMAQDVIGNANLEVAALADAIIGSQTDEITLMESLLAQLGG